jgi:hypothetical protein
MNDKHDDEPPFDPLLSDQPLDLDAIRADEELMQAIATGQIDAARALRGEDDQLLISLLGVWVRSGRPATHLLPVGKSQVTGCCHRRVADLPKDNAVTDDPDAVTCPEMDR